jgi:hypothetical protein
MMKKNQGPWPTIKADSAKLRRAIDQLVTLVASNQNEAISAANILKNELGAWRDLIQRAQATIEPILMSVQERVERATDAFTEELKAGLANAGMTVYGDGNLLIADGIIHIQSDTSSGSLRINGEEAGTFDVQTITNLVQKRSQQLKEDNTAPVDLLNQLRSAYELARTAEAKEYGTQLQTTSLLPYLAILRQKPTFRNNPTKEQFQSYIFEQFRADLYRLLSDGNLTTKDETLRYASGSDTKGAVFMLVPALGRTAHVGRIWFERATA